MVPPWSGRSMNDGKKIAWWAFFLCNKQLVDTRSKSKTLRLFAKLQLSRHHLGPMKSLLQAILLCQSKSGKWRQCHGWRQPSTRLRQPIIILLKKNYRWENCGHLFPSSPLKNTCTRAAREWNGSVLVLYILMPSSTQGATLEFRPGSILSYFIKQFHQESSDVLLLWLTQNSRVITITVVQQSE